MISRCSRSGVIAVRGVDGGATISAAGRACTERGGQEVTWSVFRNEPLKELKNDLDVAGLQACLHSGKPLLRAQARPIGSHHFYAVIASVRDCLLCDHKLVVQLLTGERPFVWSVAVKGG